MTLAHWPRIAPALFYEDAAAAIAWLCEAFGFEVRLKVEGPDGSIEHSELVYKDGLVMVGGAGRDAKPGRPDLAYCKSPKSLGGANTQSLCVTVDDADAHCARARARGADVFFEPQTQDYGAEYGVHRTYGALDIEGHAWWFQHIVRAPKPK